MKTLIKHTAATLALVASINSIAVAQTTVKQGVIYEANGQAMARLGVNYNTPFAFGYRAAKRLGVDAKQAIDMDVDHIARLGLDSYRVHVWDREISDQDGNLLNNEHMELFDYLMMRLAQHNIKSIITPIAWWGNGYPEPDQPTQGYANKYSKSGMNAEAQAITETQNYLRQFVQHKNRYTGVKLMDDPNILAFELFNEPKHLDAQATTPYLNTLIDTLKDIGVKQPLFYNISEQGDWQDFAKAVCSAKLDGIAFQWYPTGLIKNTRLNTNVLPNVAHYHNPFANIDACQDKAKMIYEFDAADSSRSVMYPAMARSFRSAGFQWATQFAYDPAITAHSNAEYNTHYMNLLYTPKKALGLMIAGYAFRELPLNYQQDSYPANNQFGNFSINYHKDLAIYNHTNRFIYSNSTSAKPKSPRRLTQVAGTGSSPIVQYAGTGAYFLDKLASGQWRLEVYPDVLKRDDAYRTGSLKREVRRLYAAKRQFTLDLVDLGNDFWLTPLNQASQGQSVQLNAAQKVERGQFAVEPGIYLLSSQAVSQAQIAKIDNTFLLPANVKQDKPLAVWHQAQRAFNLTDEVTFTFQTGDASGADLSADLYVRYKEDAKFAVFAMDKKPGNQFSFTLPKDWTRTGILQYGIVINQFDQQITFPGHATGNPNQWDFVAKQDFWQSRLQASGTPIALLDPSSDWDVKIYPKKGHSKWTHKFTESGQSVVLQLGMDALKADNANWLARFAYAEDNSLAGRDLKGYDHLLVKIKGHGAQEHVHFGVLDKDGIAFGTEFSVTNQWQYKLIPLPSLKPVTSMLTKSYPMFMPAERQLTPEKNKLAASDMRYSQGLQIGFSIDKYAKNQRDKWHGIEIEQITLYKK
ncbi:hypothetical protein C2869_21930 (plasmid) [Saccharobesus litoralis]|uniref:Cellulase (Glycosyl hydrolase family 5) n=1 Tax=Saccharobesus litoralis TaxID=2172099 RepID=A0A2S0VYB2_9ALTE|nr:hypothetical protein [Saccharobesus litoralis]AWB69165.1 hypothetical protein C2869_21930 [Saccharobesus litoralis]